MVKARPNKAASGRVCWAATKDLSYGAVTGGCPPAPQQLMIAHTFSVSELGEAARNPRTSLIIHRGLLHGINGFRVAAEHVELGVVWTNKTSEIAGVSSRELLAALYEGITIGGKGAREWKIFCHAGELNRRALRAGLGLSREFVPLSAGIHLLANYKELAEAARVTPNALLLGLRGNDSSDPSLQVVSIDGWAPVDRRQCERYPFQYEVHCYVRRDLTSILQCTAMSHIEEIGRRVSCDEQILLGRNAKEFRPALAGRAA
jgi:hypothetical protein